MKIAIISDIHGNLEALNETLAYLDAHRIDTLYCLGDIVGYGANPNECCNLVRRRNAVVVLGNHDTALWDDELLTYFSPLALTAVRWTRSVIGEAEKKYLQSLLFVETEGDSTFVHSSLDDPSTFQYLVDEADARVSMRLNTTPLCWIGHTHTPSIFSAKGRVSNVTRGARYVVNVGSVGQPRDGDPRLSFGIFDTKRFVYENIRLTYDVETACRKIIDTGLPPRLGERLIIGV